mgnify:CR=1 FL=1
MFVALDVFGKFQLPLYFVALTAFVLNLSIARKHHAKDVIFGTVSAAWIAFCTVSLPAGMLALHNIPSMLVLSENLFFFFVRGICDIIINKFAILLWIVFAIVTIMLIIAMIIVNSRKKEEYSLRAYIGEDGEILNEMYIEKNS